MEDYVERDLLPPLSKSKISDLIRQKHKHYATLAKRYCALYYTTRLMVTLAAGLLPFILSNVIFSTTLSVIVVIGSVIDVVFNPKDKWKLFAKATNMITVAGLKNSGEYEKYIDELSILKETEDAHLEQATDIRKLLDEINSIKKRTI